MSEYVSCILTFYSRNQSLPEFLIFNYYVFNPNLELNLTLTLQFTATNLVHLVCDPTIHSH